jgi:actin
LSVAHKHISQDIKEKSCYVALDFENECMSNMLGKTYMLPDGQAVELSSERIKCPEVLFQPNLVGSECEGIHRQIFNLISKGEIDIRRSLYSNIVLSGGSTLFPGFEQRLRKEIVCLAPKTINVAVHAPVKRNLSVWIGGSIIGSMTGYRGLWLSKTDYEEFGPTTLSRFI